MFWILVLAGLAIVLVLALLHDRRRRGSLRRIASADDDPAVSAAKGEFQLRKTRSTGPGQGG